jgi:hypothetical protein
MLYREKREKDMQDERSYRTQRRLLVLGMCLGYLGCLLTLWYIWKAPRQWWFDTFWLHIGANRFTLMLIPLIIFCACYFKLLCISGDMLRFRDRHLDERQRMVRDSAHRTAYKIVMLLCLLVPLYLAAQGLFISKPAATPPTTSPNYLTIRPAIAYIHFIPMMPYSSAHSRVLPPVVEWLSTAGNHWQILQVHFVDFWQPLMVSPARPAPTAPAIAPPNTSIYYGLVLLTLLLIISTLPKAIVAWQER